ncbi:response regulator [Mucilaginibacter sp.]|jgi:DNA-binding response OmpR family regulator|uniref:response regulator n=1 Tax=Mucilaginibacter sp. TaxID=1882438 RepID=UPI002D06776C|nr:response regulator [Mucilaginibacter sp.]HTI58225.1 response regulator [Mucilaginibacter sp.]
MLKRILVLDDNEDILEVVHEALSYSQFDVKSISECAGLMAIVDEFKPDLILLDYRISGTNGGDICRQIKTHPKFGNLPVIIFSAYINHDDEILAYGCDAVINKPFDLIELIAKVNELVY